MVIEQRIRPLVDALTDTELLVTYSSCEGHFGETERLGFNDREMAEVRFELKEQISESDVEQLFGHLIGNHVNSPLMWKATLTIHKEYVPGDKSDFIPDHVYAFQIRPFDPNDSDTTKRANVDMVIDQSIQSIKEYMDGKQSQTPDLCS